MSRTIRGIETVRCRTDIVGRSECELDLIDAPRYDHHGDRENVTVEDVRFEGGFYIPVSEISAGIGFSTKTNSVFEAEDRETDIDCTIDGDLMTCKSRRS